MDKKKILIAACAAVLAVGAVLSGGTSPVTALDSLLEATRQTALLSAGVKLSENTAETGEIITSEEENLTQAANITAETEEIPAHTEETPVKTEEAPAITAEIPDIEDITEEAENPTEAGVISRNITPFDDELDYNAAGNKSGKIYREEFSGYQGTDYITLKEGGLVWNCTNDSPEVIENAAAKLPDIKLESDSPQPQVLIVHTHTTESFEPYSRDYYDNDFPFRTRDPRHNMTAVGEILSETLAERGISVLHDGTVHDYPAYTGAYDRSEATIRKALEEYPSIKIIIDLHRDAIISEDGSRTAPAVEIDGRSAAQFMIIAGCDDGRFGNMPFYKENLSLACLIQDSAEKLYPGLARPVLFDYRNYNQHISTGSLLIEVGGHANSLDEALYTGELLGEILADALSQLAE